MLRATVASLLLASALVCGASAAAQAVALPADAVTAAASTSTGLPSARNDDKSSFTVSLQGAQVRTSSSSSTQIWYGVSAVGGGYERTYAATVPAKGGFVEFSGTRQFPGGYCITWVMYTSFKGFYDKPLCTAPTETVPPATPDAAPDATATATEEPAAAPSAATATPTSTPVAASATPSPEARPTSSSAPSATPSTTPTATPTATATATASPRTAAPVDVALPDDTALVDAGTSMRDSFSTMSGQAAQDSADAVSGDSSMGYVVGGAVGLAAAAGGAGMLLLRLGRRG